MGLIEKCRPSERLRAGVHLHVLRLRYWWLDTESGQRAHVWAFAVMLLLTIAQFARLAVLATVAPPQLQQAVWPAWVVQLIIALVSAVISWALRPKVEPPKPAEGKTPTTEDGRAVPEAHGTVWIEDEFMLAYKVVGRVPIKEKAGKK